MRTKFTLIKIFTLPLDMHAPRELCHAVLVFGLMMGATSATAQEAHTDPPNANNCQPQEQIKFRGLTARLENDLFADTDQNYTSGVAFTAVSHDIVGQLKPECLPTPVRLQAELITLLNPGFWADAENPAHSQNVVVKFGQSMYTPQDPARTDLILNDRPYAGLLYVGMAWNRRKHEPQGDSEILDTRELTLGVIGPLALAEEAQNLVHDVIGVDQFQGWDNQLGNEPALQMALDRKFKAYRGTGAITPGFSADTIRRLGLQLGNIETSAMVGIEGRVGWNIPNDFGTYPIRPGAENRPPSASSIHGGRATAPRWPPGRVPASIFLERWRPSWCCTTTRLTATFFSPATASPEFPGLRRLLSGLARRVRWQATASSWPS
jgi:lipid A 3-O-deacylase